MAPTNEYRGIEERNQVPHCDEEGLTGRLTPASGSCNFDQGLCAFSASPWTGS